LTNEGAPLFRYNRFAQRKAYSAVWARWEEIRSPASRNRAAGWDLWAAASAPEHHEQNVVISKRVSYS